MNPEPTGQDRAAILDAWCDEAVQQGWHIESREGLTATAVKSDLWHELGGGFVVLVGCLLIGGLAQEALDVPVFIPLIVFAIGYTVYAMATAAQRRTVSVDVDGTLLTQTPKS
jgi:hypothetical protein